MASRRFEIPEGVTPVLSTDDIIEMVPRLASHRGLVDGLLHLLKVDEVNYVHSRFCDTPGAEFVRKLVEDDLHLKLRVDNRRVLENLPQGPFITVSNHPFGALDGIVLIYLLTRYRPEYKVMVNMVLNRLWAMRPNFIAVDPMASADPAKKAVSMRGIKEAIMQVRSGHPIGFFPAGAMSKVNWRLRLQDRPWQENIIRLIMQLNVPVIPIFFNGTNSWWFNFLGVACWQARTLRLPAEIFRKRGREIHVSVGNPISVEVLRSHSGSVEELGRFLRERTYSLRCK